MKHSNINKTALGLAHSIKGAYSSFRIALLVAYKVLKSSVARMSVLAGLALAEVSLTRLAVYGKARAMANAWLSIYNLEYLD